MVFEAIKRWRSNQTTIIITHDLSQIGSNDFVYVLKAGYVAEQGYRYDLETSEHGEFRDMMETQGATGGYLPEKEDPPLVDAQIILEQEAKQQKEKDVRPFDLKHQSLAGAVVRGSWMLDAVADLTKNTLPRAVVADREARKVSRFISPESLATPVVRPRRPSSVHVASLPQPPSAALTPSARNRLSLQFTPTSPSFTLRDTSLWAPSTIQLVEDDNEFDAEKRALKKSGSEAALKRMSDASRPRPHRVRVPAPQDMHATTIKVEKPEEWKEEEEMQPFWSLVRDVYPTIPHKPFLALGVFVCLMSGSMTPIFSFFLSRLMFEVSIGASHPGIINILGGLVLGIAALDGILLGLKYFIMETAAMGWVTRIRKSCYALVLQQDKRWFDRSENTPAHVVQVLIKDGDDARKLLALVLGQSCVVAAMLGVGLIWALARGWQLTLIGFAVTPAFAATMAIQARFVAKCELRNKRARDDVAKGYYEVRRSFLLSRPLT